MTKQVVTLEKVEEARAELLREGIAPSVDKILIRTGGSKTTVTRLNREIEEGLAASLALGADLPPAFLATLVDIGRKALTHANVIATQRHEEERVQFRLSREAHLAELSQLEETQAETNQSLLSARLEIEDRRKKFELMEIELHETAMRIVELDNSLIVERAENRTLGEELRRLADYRRVAILLEEAEKKSDMSVRNALDVPVFEVPATEQLGEKQLDIESYYEMSGG